MICKGCGRELESNEKDYCPNCRNNNNKQQKTGMAKLGATLGAIVICVVGAIKIFGNKNGSA